MQFPLVGAVGDVKGAMGEHCSTGVALELRLHAVVAVVTHFQMFKVTVVLQVQVRRLSSDVLQACR